MYSLPRLPVPSLDQTTSKFLAAVEPLQTKEEHDATKKLVRDFISGILLIGTITNWNLPFPPLYLLGPSSPKTRKFLRCH